VLALLIRAGASSFEASPSLTLELLNKAEELARAVSMGFHVAACQYREGTLLGGSEGRELVQAAEGWAKSQGVVNPPRIFDTFVRGLFLERPHRR
jgi:hypothetical protein